MNDPYDSGPMDPASAARLTEAADRATEIHRLAHRRHDPMPGSQAALDLAEAPYARWIITGASMAVGVASDHLLAWRSIVRGKDIPVYAPMTLLRSALEGAVTARWLVDPRPDPTVRVARAVAMQLDDFRERRLFEDAVRRTIISAGRTPSPVTPPAKSAADRHAELTADRDAAGIPAMTMARLMDLMTGFGAPGYRDISYLYRLMSAFAHAKPWALLVSSDGSADRVESDDLIIIQSTIDVTNVVAVAIDDVDRYLGPS